MIIVRNNWRVEDPQQWEAYSWEQLNCNQYNVERKVDLEKSVDYIFRCADIFGTSVPKYYFLPPNHDRMVGALGTAEGSRTVRLRLDADWSVAIHEMAHIIQSCQKDKWMAMVEATDDWSPHGAIFCGILAYLYEELGIWPKGEETPYGKHPTMMEINGDGIDCDFEYSSREELWNLGILPKKEYDFNTAVNNWLHKHNRIKRVNQGLGSIVQGLFESSDMPHWKAAKSDGAIEPKELFGYELNDEDFVELLTNPCHHYGIQESTGTYEATPQGFAKFTKRIEKRGIKNFLLECRGRVIDEMLGQYEEHLSYNFPHLYLDETEEWILEE
jgi:hypothetical protein